MRRGAPGLRVLGGDLRGRVITSPPGIHPTRPTPAVVRKALFDILGPSVAGFGRFVDLWAGTGSVAIEAISRGVLQCLAVERDADALRCLRSNRDRLGLKERLVVQAADALALLGRPLGNEPMVVFADPPFSDLPKELVTRVARACPIGSVFAVQLPHGHPEAALPGLDVRRYGASLLVLGIAGEVFLP